MGLLALYLAFAGGVLSVWAYYRAVKDDKYLRLGRRSLYISSGGIILSAAFLMSDILRHNFGNAYVWGYSRINILRRAGRKLPFLGTMFGDFEFLRVALYAYTKL